MRIIQLPKLIRDEESRAHTLKDCSLVIDGQNFFFNSYEESGLPYVFGSEANEHAKYLRKVLSMFKQANVKCYIVFKGGNTEMTNKIQHTKPMNFDFESNYEYVPPVFLKEVCKQVLDEAHVDYATCITESKNDCVALAQTLGCPVMSNDIHFCFSRAPYIPYTTLKFMPKKNLIACKLYNLKDFLGKYSLTEKKLAIFTGLSDTTVFPQNHFHDLLQKWHVLDTNLHLQHKKLLKWLSEHNEAEILDGISKFLNSEDENKKILSHIDNVLDGMLHSEPGVVSDYLYNNRKVNVNRSDPLWFEKGIAMQNIAIPYINLYKHKLIQGSWAIEKRNSTDSIILSMDIIKYAYNLLTNYQTNVISIYQNAEHFININTGDLNIEKPKYECTESIFQNGWKDIKRFKLFEHFFIENDIDPELFNQFPVEARMLFITLTYFARKKAIENIKVMREIYCFIVSYVILHIVMDKKESFRKKASKISEKDSAEAIDVTKKYFKFNKHLARSIFDGEILKTLVELQLCLVHMNYLNALCGMPYKPTTYHRTFNGTFIYQMLHDMTTRNSDDDDFLINLFHTAPSVLKFINMLITNLNQIL